MSERLEGMVDITAEKMPDALRNKLSNMTSFARKYAEYRAKGLKQADAAQKAGSVANGRQGLSKVGWNTEQQDGVKEYILWLEHKRAKASVIDNLELVQKLRDVYDEAMSAGKYNDANKAIELLGNMIGAFSKEKQKGIEKEEYLPQEKKKIKNNTNVFLEETENEGIEERIKRLTSLTTKGLK